MQSGRQEVHVGPAGRLLYAMGTRCRSSMINTLTMSDLSVCPYPPSADQHEPSGEHGRLEPPSYDTHSPEMTGPAAPSGTERQSIGRRDGLRWHTMPLTKPRSSVLMLSACLPAAHRCRAPISLACGWIVCCSTSTWPRSRSRPCHLSARSGCRAAAPGPSRPTTSASAAASRCRCPDLALLRLGRAWVVMQGRRCKVETEARHCTHKYSAFFRVALRGFGVSVSCASCLNYGPVAYAAPLLRCLHHDDHHSTASAIRLSPSCYRLHPPLSTSHLRLDSAQVVTPRPHPSLCTCGRRPVPG